MTVWTRAQIEQARGLRAQESVSREVMDSARTDVIRAIHARLARQIIDFAHPFVIEIDPADLRFVDHPGEKVWEPTTVRCWWEPQTEQVELRGGEQDGTVMAVRGAPYAPLIVSVSASLMALGDVPPQPIAPVSTRTLRFECTGWDEVARRWVYTIESRA